MMYDVKMQDVRLRSKSYCTLYVPYNGKTIGWIESVERVYTDQTALAADRGLPDFCIRADPRRSQIERIEDTTQMEVIRFSCPELS